MLSWQLDMGIWSWEKSELEILFFFRVISILMELKFMTTDEIIKVFTNTTIYFITTPASSLIHFQRGR